MNLKSIITETPNWPSEGINFLDITPILENPAVFDYCVDQFITLAKSATSIVAVESRGFPLGAVIANRLSIPLVLVRKPNKLPRPVYSESYVTEYSTDTLEIKQSANIGTHPMIIDDLLATGGTVNAVVTLLKKNFNPVSISCGVIINLSFLPGEQLLRDLQIDLMSLETY
jgi:adenine phosphoribosyltransferase